MKRMIIKTTAAAAAVLAVIFSASCGSPELSAPGGLTAEPPDADNPNRIELSWLPVEDADIYYLYRSSSKDGKYSNVGHSVTSADIETEDGAEENRYLFVENFETGEGGTYWYGVTAASNIDIGAESAMSTAVSAQTYEGTWSTAKLLGVGDHIDLAADASALYALYSAAGAGSALKVSKYAADPDDESDNPALIWTSAGSPGAIAGGSRPFSAFVSGGELHTLFSDNAEGGKATLKYYENTGSDDAPVYSWTTLGIAGFNAAAADSMSAAAVGFGGTVYAGFLETAAEKLWKYNTTLSEWDERAIGQLPADAGNIRLIDFNNNLYFGYEDVNTAGLYLRAYDDTAQELQTVNPTTTIETGDIDDGNAVFVSGGGSLYAVYLMADNSFGAEQLVDNVWTPLSNTSGKPATTAAASAYGTLDAVWFDNALYVFYVDSAATGWVKYYDEDEGWKNAETGGGAVTGGGITQVALVSAGNLLYAGYTDGTDAYVTIFE